jgi:hypothetical protein
MTATCVFAILLAGAPGVAAEPAAELLAHFRGEPSVTTLQRAAAEWAEVNPERVRSWLARVRKATLLPALRVRIGRGLGGLAITRGTNGIERLSTVDSDTWRFEIEATWHLDRLLFDSNELRLSREAQRVATRREQLATEVARVYFARRRLQVDSMLDTAAPQTLELDRTLAIEELTAILDGLTGNRLSRGGQR